MSAITGTLAKRTELAGDSKLYVITAPIATADDDITLTAATHGITEIEGIVGAVITAGADANYSAIQVSYSGLVVTVVSLEADGTVATGFTDTTVSITLLGKSE